MMELKLESWMFKVSGGARDDVGLVGAYEWDRNNHVLCRAQ